MIVNAVCRNFGDDRVIPRFARYLRDFLGWRLTKRPVDPGQVDAYYLSGYFEAQFMRPWPEGRPVGAYFTHREEEPPGNAKAKLYDNVAGRVDLRIATAAMYAGPLVEYGATAQITPPVERGRFVIPKGPSTGSGRLAVGFSGYTYRNGRKGEALARALVGSNLARKVDWRASGRGWPVPTRKYRWEEMPGFYQSLDVLVVTSSVEGVPMPPLECLSCGVSVVIPRGVGLLDELPEEPGIYRYEKNQAKSCLSALRKALGERRDVNREKLRETTAPYTITAWCEQHRQAFAEVML
jgi:glycosyltransferase involved in cell wall biosynthesis